MSNSVSELFIIFLISLFNALFPLLLVALQKHFKNLEALALDRDEPEEVIDLTGIN